MVGIVVVGHGRLGDGDGAGARERARARWRPRGGVVTAADGPPRTSASASRAAVRGSTGETACIILTDMLGDTADQPEPARSRASSGARGGGRRQHADPDQARPACGTRWTRVRWRSSSALRPGAHLLRRPSRRSRARRAADAADGRRSAARAPRDPRDQEPARPARPRGGPAGADGEPLRGRGDGGEGRRRP